jgi:acetate kinase
LVFTGGIGENADAVREGVCRRSAWLGIDLDAAANAHGDERISTAASLVAVWVISTDEELMIARHTSAILHQLKRRSSDESGRNEASRGRQAS